MMMREQTPLERELIAALYRIAQRKDHCLLGPESSEAEEMAYREGSAAAFGQCATEALSALSAASGRAPTNKEE